MDVPYEQLVPWPAELVAFRDAQQGRLDWRLPGGTVEVRRALDTPYAVMLRPNPSATQDEQRRALIVANDWARALLEHLGHEFSEFDVAWASLDQLWADRDGRRENNFEPGTTQREVAAALARSVIADLRWFVAYKEAERDRWPQGSAGAEHEFEIWRIELGPDCDSAGRERAVAVLRDLGYRVADAAAICDELIAELERGESPTKVPKLTARRVKERMQRYRREHPR